MKVLAIDIGSSSARIMLVDGADMRPIELYRQSHTSYQDDNGHFRWDIDKLFDGLKSAVDRIISEQDIDGIGICSWGVDYGVIDADGQLIDSPYCYRDIRTSNILDECIAKYGGYRLFEQTAIYPNAINTVYQLLADKRDRRYGSGVRIALIADLFAYRLTGNIYAEASNASSTQLLAKSGREWNYKLIRELGLDSSIFPTIINTGEKYGDYRGVPVIAVGTHDTASAIYAMGDMGEDTAFVSSGSWLLVGKVLNEPLINEKVFQIGYTNERICYNKVSLLANINGLFVIQRIVAESGISYKDIDSSMDKAKVLGVLDTDRLMSPNGMIDNILAMLNLDSADIMDIVKTAYYSLAVRLSVALNDLSEVTNCHINRIILTGGASKAKYFLDSFKGLSGVEIEIAAGEGAVLGNAMIQLRTLAE